MERKKACFVISSLVLACLLSITSNQGIGQKVANKDYQASPASPRPPDAPGSSDQLFSSFILAPSVVQDQVPAFSFSPYHRYNFMGGTNEIYGFTLSQGSAINNTSLGPQFLVEGIMENSTQSMNQSQSNVFNFQYVTRFPRNGTDFMLQLNLWDSSIMNQSGFGLKSMISISIANETIPVHLWNCGGYSMNNSGLYYQDNTPMLNNTITFSNITLPSYNQTQSLVNMNFREVFRGNWTEFTTRYEMDLDLTRCHLYSPSTHQEYATGTPFSVNVIYSLLFSRNNSAGGYTTIPPQVFSNRLVYNTGLDKFGFNVSSADISMNDTYQDVRTNQRYIREAKSQFTISQGSTNDSAYANHILENFSYGDTTNIYCDPVVRVEHDRISSNTVNQTTPTPTSTPGFPVDVTLLGLGIGIVGMVVIVSRKHHLDV